LIPGNDLVGHVDDFDIDVAEPVAYELLDLTGFDHGLPVTSVDASGTRLLQTGRV
jgi:hypothetical protein